MNDAGLVARFRAARRDSKLVVLEGLHALKHALRFGADIISAASADVDGVRALARELAPDVVDGIGALCEPCDWRTFAALAPTPHATGVIALARRPDVCAADIAATGTGPVIVLHDPQNLGNVGAVVRVAAALDSGGVLVVGGADPWNPTAVRGAAGLQFALPCARTDTLPFTRRPLVAFATGDASDDQAPLPPDALLAFGSERRGLPPAVIHAAARVTAIAMRPGVSSLNLATSVAIALDRLRDRAQAP